MKFFNSRYSTLLEFMFYLESNKMHKCYFIMWKSNDKYILTYSNAAFGHADVALCECGIQSDSFLSIFQGFLIHPQHHVACRSVSIVCCIVRAKLNSFIIHSQGTLVIFEFIQMITTFFLFFGHPKNQWWDVFSS